MYGNYADTGQYYNQRNAQFSDTMMGLVNALFQIKQMKQGQENWKQEQGLKEKQLASLEGSRQQEGEYYKKTLALREKEAVKPQNLPAEAALMEYMMKKGIAKDPPDAWSKINASKEAEGLTTNQKLMEHWRQRGQEYDSVDKIIGRYDDAVSSLENAMRVNPLVDHSQDLSNLNLVLGDLGGIRLALDRQEKLTPEQRMLLRKAQQIPRVRKEGYFWLGKEKTESPEKDAALKQEPEKKETKGFKIEGMITESDVPGNTQVYETADGIEVVQIDGKWKRLIKK